MKEIVTAPRSRRELRKSIALSVALTVLGIGLSTGISVVVSNPLALQDYPLLLQAAVALRDLERQHPYWFQFIMVLPFIPVFFAAQMGSQAWVRGRPRPQTATVARALRKANLGDEYTLIREPLDAPPRPVSLDCVLVGPSGIYVFDAYRARGEYRVLRDVWFTRDRHGKERRADASPVREAVRRAAALKAWLARNSVVGLPVQAWLVVSGGRAGRLERPACPVVTPESLPDAWHKLVGGTRPQLEDSARREELIHSLVEAA